MTNSSVAAVIPIKLNNTRLPNKTTRMLGDKPLYYHLFDTIKTNEYFDEIFVDSSSDFILDEAVRYGFQPIKRPEHLNSSIANGNELLRFELELDLLEGKLSIADLPSAWHERYLADLGVMAPDDRDGVLQDVHWYAGFIGGAFQGYTLGNIIGAQLFDAALRDTPDIYAQIGRGEYQSLHDWLRKNIYRIGRRRTPDQLIADVTGGPLDAKPLLNRLQDKFSTIYPG